ncbi:MAG: thioredoxin domain-containing protein, partial [Gemmatimonadaceae bacterium]|nr:thioredoxin domain-containing protein [Gemmatimonadaceae bacterium]
SRMPNRLAAESSPYLRQHADNPVDWYPWGDAAFARARAEDRPVLLSIGYAACHWCHVMAHESFEDPDTAAVMNALFVNVKVDREERPDVDGVYMTATQALTGRGGWPMTVFLTPDGAPFYAGTYFPPDDRHGMPSFRRLLRSVHDAWQHRREAVDRTADSLREMYARAGAALAPSGAVTPALLQEAVAGIVRAHDPVHHGFGDAPKFPQAMAMEFLLRQGERAGSAAARRVVHDSWHAMARGGLFDQLGGGFARYSTDAQWTVPHFEKMLYDNALLVRTGTFLWQVTGDDEVRDTVVRTIDWVLREMTGPEGGFHATLDADSEGEEGRFYVWTPDEVREACGDDADVALLAYGLTEGANFEGRSILVRRLPLGEVARRLDRDIGEVRAALERARAALLARRATRVPPALDGKRIAAWNGLMLRTLAEAARILARDDWRAAAVRAAQFTDEVLVRDDRALRTWFEGDARGPGFLEDQAALGLGFLATWELTGELHWLVRARALALRLVADFHDPVARGFWDTAHDAEALVTRPRDLTDNAVPAGTSLACELLLRLDALDDRPEWRAIVDDVLAAMAASMAEHPLAFGHLLGVADMAVHGAIEVAIVGDHAEGAALRRVLARSYLPTLVLAQQDGDRDGDTQVPVATHSHDGMRALPALLVDRTRMDDRPTAYVCRQRACDRPVTDPSAFTVQLARALRGA